MQKERNQSVRTTGEKTNSVPIQMQKTNAKNPLIIGKNDSIISLYANHSARYLFKVRR